MRRVKKEQMNLGPLMTAWSDELSDHLRKAQRSTFRERRKWTSTAADIKPKLPLLFFFEQLKTFLHQINEDVFHSNELLTSRAADCCVRA